MGREESRKGRMEKDEISNEKVEYEDKLGRQKGQVIMKGGKGERDMNCERRRD